MSWEKGWNGADCFNILKAKASNILFPEEYKISADNKLPS